MKQYNFVKYHPGIDQITGSQQGTLILSALEFWFIKKPSGFYKFMEPCSHRLYKKGDSWLEEVGLARKRFARAFEEFGIKYPSRSAFEKAEDKFKGKLYASYYDRHTNQMFFIRNHDLANETLKPYFKVKKEYNQKSEDLSKKSADSLPPKPVSTGHNGRSYKDTKITSRNLSYDKSHAEEIVKKMIEIWTDLVEEGRGKIELTNRRIAFLKQAFIDKFDSCIEKWKKYCQEIASRRFLMGEKTLWRASLDWALEFANIQKVFDKYYGPADRTPKSILPSQTTLKDEIYQTTEVQEIKAFRALCLNTVGNAKYISYFKNLTIEFPKEYQGEGGIVLIAPHKFAADELERNCYSYLRIVLQELGEKSTHIIILAPGEARGRLVEKERGGATKVIERDELSVSDPRSQEELLEIKALEDVSGEELQEDTSQETKTLRIKLRQSIPPKHFPSWLAGIEVDRIDPDGNLIVTFREQIIADYCQGRFRPDILKISKELWPTVKNLLIQEKSSNSLEFSEEESVEVDDTLIFQQALQSLKVCHKR